MDRKDRVLAAQAGVIVLGDVEQQARPGEVLDCTRSLDVINRTREDVLIDSVILRAAGSLAADRPPYRYEVIQWLRPNQRRTVLSERLFKQMKDQAQEEGAVRPFESRLRAPSALTERPPQVIVRVQLAAGVVEIPVPVMPRAA